MKTFFQLLVSVTFLYFATQNSYSQVQSSPVVSPELLTHYDKDVHSLALSYIFDNNLSAMSEIEIPTVYCDTVWTAMACVYNAFPINERDTVFDFLCIHNSQYFNSYTSDMFIESSDFSHIMAWSSGSIISGDIAIDTLLANYDFSITSQYQFGGTIMAVFHTSQYININALTALINSFPQILNAQPGTGSFGSPTRFIFYSKNQDYQFLTFRIAWGDCLSGCIDFRNWNFRIDNNFVVEFTGITQSPQYYAYAPTYSNCNFSNIPLFSYNEITFCDGDSIYYNNQWISETSVYNDTVISSVGTDSIIYNSIISVNSSTVYINANICQGENYIFYGDTLINQGNYEHIISMPNGCDSVISLDLEVQPSYEINEFIDICEGETYNFFGQIIETPGAYVNSSQTNMGCDSIIILNVNMLSLPVIEFANWFEDSIYQDSGLITLDIATPQGGTYYGNGIVQNILNPQLLNIGMSWIYYSYTDSTTGCTGIDSLQIYIIEENDIRELNFNSRIKIFPNPTSDIIQVQLQDNALIPMHLSIFNAIGNKIMDYEVINNYSSININNLSSGIYFIQLYNKQYIYFEKIIISAK